VGGYLLFTRVTVGSGAWLLWGYNAFGLSLLPLLAGIARLFYDGRSIGGWILAGLGASSSSRASSPTSIFSSPPLRCSTRW
jgi:hypothetical protein